MKINLFNSQYIKEDGTFDKENALDLSGIIAGVCYDKEGFDHLMDEPRESTVKRINKTLHDGHYSVYDHSFISFNIQNIPKIMAMILNNERQYTTSEKSARYTHIQASEYLSEEEVYLYEKWFNIFTNVLTDKYSKVLDSRKIKKLAQENARYLVSVFMPTHMIYTTSFRQINNIAAFMLRYIEEHKDSQDSFDIRLISSMKEFIANLESLNLLEPRLMKNDKNRKLSLFSENLENEKDYFGRVYSTTYKGTWAQLAQAHRHRTLSYTSSPLKEYEFFIPEFIKDNPKLLNEWINDMNRVREIYPNGQLCLINETGTYEDFILKCKERLCGEAQYEIMIQTKVTLENMKNYLYETNSPYYEEILPYCNGARCTFPDYECPNPCYNTDAITLKRKY